MKIKECAFCGSTKLSFRWWPGEDLINFNCASCGCEGPKKKDSTGSCRGME